MLTKERKDQIINKVKDSTKLMGINMYYGYLTEITGIVEFFGPNMGLGCCISSDKYSINAFFLKLENGFKFIAIHPYYTLGGPLFGL